MQPAWHAVPAEQHDAKESCFEEKGRHHFVADERRDDITGDFGEPAPIGAELVGHGDAGNDTHAEGHGEHLGPEAGQLVIAVFASLQPDTFKRCDPGRQADGEGRKDDVKRDREGKLDTREQDGIKIHGRFNLLQDVKPTLTGTLARDEASNNAC